MRPRLAVEAASIRQRLEELLSLALGYRGWSTRHLAKALDRSSSNLLPETSFPKLDFLLRLAEILQWPVEAVISHLAEEVVAPQPLDQPGAPQEEDALLARGQTALHADDPTLALRFARSAALVANSMKTRVQASELESDAWAQLGRWDCAIQAIHSALDALSRGAASLHAASPDERGVEPPGLLLRLARAYHRAGLAVEGSALATTILNACHDVDAETAAQRAEAHLLRALCFRDRHESARSMPEEPAASALRDAEEARAILRWPVVAERLPTAACLRGMADAVMLELRASLNQIGAAAALTQLLDSLEPWVDLAQAVDRSALAGAGWRCVIGLTIAARHLEGEPRHRMLAILSNKADEIASAVDCWALRERVLRLEFERRTHTPGEGSGSDQWLVDEEDLRLIIGCIGASRRFRPIGLEIIRRATRVHSAAPDFGRRGAAAG
jgi:hypothetical protein